MVASSAPEMEVGKCKAWGSLTLFVVSRVLCVYEQVHFGGWAQKCRKISDMSKKKRKCLTDTYKTDDI